VGNYSEIKIGGGAQRENLSNKKDNPEGRGSRQRCKCKITNGNVSRGLLRFKVNAAELGSSQSNIKKQIGGEKTRLKKKDSGGGIGKVQKIWSGPSTAIEGLNKPRAEET